MPVTGGPMVRTCGVFAMALLLACNIESSTIAPESDVSLAAGGAPGKSPRRGAADVTVVDLGYVRALDIEYPRTCSGVAGPMV